MTETKSYTCAACGADQREAPEGAKADGSPHHTFPHCYKCGHREDADVPQTVRDAADFAAFQRWQAEQLGDHPTLHAPEDPGVIAAMQAQIAEMQAALNERHGAPVTPPEVPQFGDGD